MDKKTENNMEKSNLTKKKLYTLFCTKERRGDIKLINQEQDKAVF